MKFIVVLVLILFFSQLTIQQLQLPLIHKKTQIHSSEAKRHHLLRQGQNNVHKIQQRSRLSHNLAYIHNKLNEEHKKSQHLLKSHLATQQPQDHLKLQTFNLKPNVYSFTLPLKVGGYKYQLNIDSGSSDIFIKGEDSKGKPQQRYKCGKKCIDNNEHYEIGYLDGSLQTYQAKLDVQIGDHKFKESILVAYQVERNFEDNQGLIGLSFPRLATNPNPTFLQTLKDQGIISVYAFGVNLNFQDKNRSFITLGSYDVNYFEGKLNYLELTSQHFYYVKTKGISIGNGQLLPIDTALFDTGNTCISIPSRYQRQILKQFNKGTGQKQNKCFFSVQTHADMFSVMRCKIGDFNSMPNLKIHLGGNEYEIQPNFYIQACDRRPKQFSSNNSATQGIWYCDLYIQSVQRMQQLFLGDGFFNRYYTYFNIQKNQIGIAKNKQQIRYQKLMQNELDADKQDWTQILGKLNEKESKDEIKAEIEKFVDQEEKKE